MVYDAGDGTWSAADVKAVVSCVDATAGALRRAGHQVLRIPVRRDMQWLEPVKSVDAVFNLCEGINGLSHMEYKVAATIELMGLPMTGVTTWTMVLCHRKSVLNAMLSSAGIPIPDWCAAQKVSDIPSRFPLPAIVKPLGEDASVGVDQGAVVTTRKALKERVAWGIEQFENVLVQRYIAGREVAVGFVGETMLPLSEISFAAMPGDHWPIVTYQAKWDPSSLDYKGTQPVCPADIEPVTAEELVQVATKAWKAVDGSGYGRIDFRIDADGKPWLLEVNPNPDSSPDAGLANMAKAAGWDYDALVVRILDVALERAGILPAPLGSDAGG